MIELTAIYLLQGPLDISEYYLNMLFFISIVWLIGFALSVKYGKNKSDAREPVKSHHASNRWLKGIEKLPTLCLTEKLILYIGEPEYLFEELERGRLFIIASISSDTGQLVER